MNDFNNSTNEKQYSLVKLLGVCAVSLLAVPILNNVAFSQKNTPKPSNQVKLLIPAQFDYASPFSEGLARVKIGQKWGYIDKQGKLVIPAQFDGYDVDAPVPLFNLSAMDKQPLRMRYPGNFSQGLAPVKVGEKWGYINKQGKFVIPPKFTCADDFSEGLAAVGEPLARGVRGMYINPQGKTIFSHRFGCTGNKFSQGLALIGEETIINKSGTVVRTLRNNFRSSAPLSVFSENLLAVGNAQGFGFINTQGRVVIPPQFRVVYPFSEGLALAEKKPGGSGGSFGFIDKTGKFVIPPNLLVPSAFSQGLAPFCSGENACGYIDKSGKVAISTQFADVSAFSENLAPVKVGNKWGYIGLPEKK
jgi:hypothetical protein